MFNIKFNTKEFMKFIFYVLQASITSHMPVMHREAALYDVYSSSKSGSDDWLSIDVILTFDWIKFDQITVLKKI